MDCCSIYFIGACVVLLPVLYRLYTKFVSMRYNIKNKVSLVGKTVIVTGANTGIGYETALECAKRGGRVIIACRDEDKGTKAVETIIRLTQNKQVFLKLLDLASFNSVKKFAADILQSEKRLDILINNAGVFWIGNQTTEDGFQLVMQVNYLAPVLLTLLLLDLLKKSSPSRIINVSSIGAKYAKNFTPETMNIHDGHLDTYDNTKLGNILFTQELAKKLKDVNVSVFSLHPGGINTNILYPRHNVFYKACITVLANIFFKDAEEGCQTTVYTALMPDIEHLTGSNFDGCKVVSPYSTARDPVLSKSIWDATMKFIKFDDKNI